MLPGPLSESVQEIAPQVQTVKQAAVFDVSFTDKTLLPRTLRARVSMFVLFGKELLCFE